LPCNRPDQRYECFPWSGLLRIVAYWPAGVRAFSSKGGFSCRSGEPAGGDVSVALCFGVVGGSYGDWRPFYGELVWSGNERNRTAMIRIGTAGWQYRDWAGIVYPKPKPRGFDELTYLAGFFNTIEINTSFYGPPRAEVARAWAERVAGH